MRDTHTARTHTPAGTQTHTHHPHRPQCSTLLWLLPCVLCCVVNGRFVDTSTARPWRDTREHATPTHTQAQTGRNVVYSACLNEIPTIYNPAQGIASHTLDMYCVDSGRKHQDVCVCAKQRHTPTHNPSPPWPHHASRQKACKQAGNVKSASAAAHKMPGQPKCGVIDSAGRGDWLALATLRTSKT